MLRMLAPDSWRVIGAGDLAERVDVRDERLKREPRYDADGARQTVRHEEEGAERDLLHVKLHEVDIVGGRVAVEIGIADIAAHGGNGSGESEHFRVARHFENMVIAVILRDPGGVAQDGGHFGGKGVIRAEGAGQLKLALILVGDGDRGPGEELDELEQNKRERVAAEDHHMRIDRDAAILEAVVEAVADGVGKNTVLERHAGAQLLDLAHVQHNVLCQNGDTGCVAAMRLQPGFAIAACAAEIPCVAADGVANAEAA